MVNATTSTGVPRRSAPDDKRVILLATKISARERKAFDELRRKLGGEIPAREADAFRFALAEACRARGIPWPDDEDPPEPGVEKEGGR